MKNKAGVVSLVRGKWLLLNGGLNELQRRHWCAAEALCLGRGGTAAIFAATGVAKDTIAKGISELSGGASLPPGRASAKAEAGGKHSPTTIPNCAG